LTNFHPVIIIVSNHENRVAMKKHVTIGRLALSAVLILSFIPATAGPTTTPPTELEWGSPIVRVKSSIPAGASIIQFTPADDPNYENKIMSYITAIDADLIKKITIVRIKNQPMVDYLFVSDRLYTIMENWGEIEPKKSKEIESTLTTQYGAPLVQQDKNFFIYSFNNDKTKVLYYLMKQTDGNSKCIVYYYTKKLFRMLITE
jgi:hypothetical protein